MSHPLAAKFQFIKSIRQFFDEQGFLDVLTPIAVENPGMEPHIHPFALYSIKDNKLTHEYLHTSPEFYMKKLLSEGMEKIYTLNYCFRDEPNSPIHRNQFLMLEWYRAFEHYDKIMSDTQELIQYQLNFLKEKNGQFDQTLINAKFQKATVNELFLEYANINILDYPDRLELRKFIEKDFSHIPLPPQNEELSWDDCFFLLFLNLIEPQLEKIPFLLLFEYPKQLSALSTIKESDPRVCERFEIYIKGVEIANCFNELTDLKEQQLRFKEQAQVKTDLYNYTLPSPTVLYNALEKGLPKSSGIALGVERLYQSLSLLPGF